MGFVRFLMLLSLVIWVGGILFFAFVLAPTVFAVLPTRDLAGQVVAHTLPPLHWIGVVSGVVFLLASTLDALNTPGVRHGMSRNTLVTIMLLLTLASQLGVTRRMESLRRDMGVIDSVLLADPRRVSFDRLHQLSTGLEGAVLLLGIATIYLLAREQ
jgi:hypothetical protein